MQVAKSSCAFLFNGRPGSSFGIALPADSTARFDIEHRSQTPTFNAPPVVEAALDAVKRGIEVTIYADLGFNDEVSLVRSEMLRAWADRRRFGACTQGELLPFQGGTNEMVAQSMYEELDTDEQKDRLKMYWYTGKDQVQPLNAKEKSRNCHVKLMIVDDMVGIQGKWCPPASNACSRWEQLRGAERLIHFSIWIK